VTDVMDLTSVGDRADQFFAGRRFTGVCMIAAPLLLTAGAVLLMGIYGGSPSARVGAYADNEVRASVAVNLAIAGTVLATFALAGVAALVATRRPGLGRAGGVLAIIGLFGPAFYLGINHVGIRLGDLADRAGAGAVFQDAEATPNIVNLAGPALLVGFLLLAIGTAKAGVLPRWRSWALGLAALAPVGLMSGIVVISIVAWLALAFALAPLGRDILRADASDG
jgi:hypothetical protein